MRSLIVALLVAIPACDIGNLDLGLDSSRHLAAAYYDGHSVAITACPTDGFLGCGSPQPDDAVELTYNNQKLEVPADPDADVVLGASGALANAPFQATIPAPWNGRLDLTINGTTATVDLPSGFAIDALPATLSRAAGALDVTFERLAEVNAEPTAALYATCADGTQRIDAFAEVTEGELLLTFDQLPASAGACDEELEITEPVLSSDPAIETEIYRIERATFTSEP